MASSDPFVAAATPSDAVLTPPPGPLPGPSGSSSAPAVNRRLPVDGGLAGLGLVTLVAAATGFVLIITLFVLARTFGLGGSAAGLLPSLGIFAVSLVRTGFHLGVGRAATKRLPIVGDQARRYLYVSIFHSVVIVAILLFLWNNGPIMKVVPLAIGLVILLMAWPVTLYLLTNRRAVRSIFEAVDTFDVGLVPGDRSIGAAGLLMTVFGSVFLLTNIALFAVLVAEKVPVEVRTIPWFVLLLLSAVRSSLHLGWGLAALRGKMDFGRFRRVVEVYLWIGFATVIAVLGAMFAMEEFRIAFRKAPINMIYFSVIIVSGLMAWPSVLKAFVQDTVPFWDEDADRERAFRPAVDRGLTALGFLHVALAVWALGQWFLAALGLRLTALVPDVAATTTLLETLLWPVVPALQLWVGLELIHMSQRYQRAALVYTAAAVIVTTTLLATGAHAQPSDEATTASTITTVLDVLASMVLPLITIVLTRARPLEDEPPVG